MTIKTKKLLSLFSKTDMCFAPPPPCFSLCCKIKAFKVSLFS